MPIAKKLKASACSDHKKTEKTNDFQEKMLTTFQKRSVILDFKSNEFKVNKSRKRNADLELDFGV